MPHGSKRVRSLDRQAGSQGVGRGKGKKARGDSTAGEFPDCIECCLATRETNSLHCTICNEAYHADCCGTDGLTDSDVVLLNNVGWACVSCRENARSAFDQLQAKNSKLSVLLAQLTQRVAKLEKTSMYVKPSIGEKASNAANGSGGGTELGRNDEGDSSGSRIGGNAGGGSGNAADRPDESWATVVGRGAVAGRVSAATRQSSVAGASSELTYNDAVKLIKKTVSEASRRKSNVVVSGLPERSATGPTDATRLNEISFGVLDYSLSEVVINTKRLGKTISNDKPRRILITMKSESAAAELLARARWLRDATDPYIARNVYINRDLSQEEEREAYERRLARRAAPPPPHGAAGATEGAGADGPHNHTSRTVYRSQESVPTAGPLVDSSVPPPDAGPSVDSSVPPPEPAPRSATAPTPAPAPSVGTADEIGVSSMDGPGRPS